MLTPICSFVTKRRRNTDPQSSITEKRHSDGLGLLTVSIFATLLGIPKLDGANCTGQWSLFDEPERGDPARREVVDSALRLCATCPALAPCGTWFDRLPLDERPTGVVAGRLRRYAIRPRVAAA